MRYIIIGAITLVVTLLVSKVFLALNLVHFNKYNTSLAKSHGDNQQMGELVKTGKSLYLVYCSSCHGKDGKGNKNKAQDQRWKNTLSQASYPTLTSVLLTLQVAIGGCVRTRRAWG